MQQGLTIYYTAQAKYCYLCGTQLRANCAHCGELIVYTKYKFYPVCGKPYKMVSQNRYNVDRAGITRLGMQVFTCISAQYI
nr:zinc ribbon domain-containing protein [Nostoc punctiforme]